MWHKSITAVALTVTGSEARQSQNLQIVSAPGEVYPQKWCTTLWVNEQNMMYERAGIKREALKRQPAAGALLDRMQRLFMLRIYRSPQRFCFCWQALMPETTPAGNPSIPYRKAPGTEIRSRYYPPAGDNPGGTLPFREG